MSHRQILAAWIDDGRDRDVCWVDGTWSVRKDGYGVMHYDGKVRLAHRVAYHLEHGEYPMPATTHLCGQRLCVNPDHLEAATPQVTDDMVDRDRADFFGRNGRLPAMTRGAIRQRLYRARQRRP